MSGHERSFARMNTKILVVDDNVEFRTMVALLLSTESIEVVPAETAKECLQIMREGFRGLILMDVHMPDKDGWDIIRMLVDEQLIQGNLVCMLTGDLEPGAKSEGLQEYVFNYITKPFNPQTFIQTIRNALSYLPVPPAA
jgi:CheY-like chemotaxis protein